MAKTKDYYKVLGLEEKATADEIKKTYRKLARQYHPDRNPDDAKAEARFKEVQEAYETLSDVDKRKTYDRMRKNPFGGAFGEGFATSAGSRFYRSPDGTFVRNGDGGTPGEGPGFGDLFGDLFGRMFRGDEEPPPTGGYAGARTGARAGTAPRRFDRETRVRLSFKDALEGGKREIAIGGGKKVRMTIPKGVEDGFKVRLRGRGETAPDGARGDLYVTFEVTPHPRFRREDEDLYTTVEIKVFEALLGTTRHLTTAYGKRIKLTIPEGTQPGETLRLRGQGVETDEAKGDLYVEIKVVLPQHLTDEQRATLRRAAEEADLG